jgi:hypothetical protein
LDSKNIGRSGDEIERTGRGNLPLVTPVLIHG